MDDLIRIQQTAGPRTQALDVEIVERKGLGHPDTLCDSIMDEISRTLARTYLERAGAVLHYNCDKAMLIAGRVDHRWGGGSVVEPMRLVMGDRATSTWRGQDLQIRDIAVECARNWIRAHLERVDPVRHVRFDVALKPGATELAGLYTQAFVGANDTSAAVGYAPMTDTERLVLEIELHANGTAFKARFPEAGEDVKVMGVRSGRSLHLTIAMPLVDRYLANEREYFDRKQLIYDALVSHLRTIQPPAIDDISLTLNALDRPGEGFDGIYASVLGTSAESADSGEVGRGNRANGLISLCRPAGSEAAAGKNPVGHVGKIYSLLAFRLAETLVARIDGLEEVCIWLCSEIGRPVSRPQQVFLLTHLARGAVLGDVDRQVRAIVAEALDDLPAFCRRLITTNDREPPVNTPATTAPTA
jgi:S-adenosylmethionine synthetase